MFHVHLENLVKNNELEGGLGQESWDILQRADAYGAFEEWKCKI